MEISAISAIQVTRGMSGITEIASYSVCMEVWVMGWGMSESPSRPSHFKFILPLDERASERPIV